MEVFVKDYWETMQAGVVIFGMQDDNDGTKLYHGIYNRFCPVCSSLYLLSFLSLLHLFLSLFIFHQRHRPYALKALKQGYSQIF